MRLCVLVGGCSRIACYRMYIRLYNQLVVGGVLVIQSSDSLRVRSCYIALPAYCSSTLLEGYLNVWSQEIGGGDVRVLR